MTTKVKKFSTSIILGAFTFWSSLAVPYLLNRGFDLSQIFTLLSFYAICVVVLEYPTGVIGDHFGHKFSLYLSNLLGFAAFVLVSFDLPLFLYYFAVFLMALGYTLLSGSDVAFLKSISNNFSQDLSIYKSMIDVAAFISAFMAGFIANISYQTAFILSGSLYLLANLLLFFVKTDKPHSNQVSSNVFVTAKCGLDYVLKNKYLIYTLILSAVITSFMLSVKTILGSFREILAVNVELIGIFIAFSMMARATGKFFANKFTKLKLTHLIFSYISLIGLASLGIHKFYPPLVLIVSNLIVGMISIKLLLKINQQVIDSYRASTLSLHGLISRILSSLVLLGFGYVTKMLSYSFFMLGIVVVMLVVVIIYPKSLD